jgi:hypothetical protein
MAEEAKPKTIKIAIPWTVIALLVILVVGLILFFVISSKKSLVECNSQACFSKQFSSCQPAEWTATEASEELSIHYMINNKVSNGCSVTFSSNQTSSIKITCNYDNKMSFFNAEAAASANPRKFDCQKD